MDDAQFIKILNTSIKVMQSTLATAEAAKEGQVSKAFKMLGAVQGTLGTLEVYAENPELKQALKTMNELLSL